MQIGYTAPTFRNILHFFVNCLWSRFMSCPRPPEKSYLARLYCRRMLACDDIYCLPSCRDDSGSGLWRQLQFCTQMKAVLVGYLFIYLFIWHARWDHPPETRPNLSIDFLYKSIRGSLMCVKPRSHQVNAVDGLYFSRRDCLIISKLSPFCLHLSVLSH